VKFLSETRNTDEVVGVTEVIKHRLLRRGMLFMSFLFKVHLVCIDRFVFLDSVTTRLRLIGGKSCR